MNDLEKAFTKAYHGNRNNTWCDTKWLGTYTYKFPTDLWIYQELLYELQPDLVIETGTCEGGSALYLASIMDLIGKGHVWTIDIRHYDNQPDHPRISYVVGSSTDPDNIAMAKQVIDLCKFTKVMVILDSDHSAQHVLKELELYSPFVTLGSYLICEDTIVGTNQLVEPGQGMGPAEAVEKFLETHDEFVSDSRCERLMLTAQPKGFLKKVKRWPASPS